jgi:UDP-N-acetyl-2-amino-2-deoxyglucuronate dehydrogenase
MMGPVVEVTAHATMLAHERIEVEDVAVATLRFANGALGVIEASTAVWPGELKRIEIHGTQGSIAMREEDIIRWEFAKKTKADEELLAKMAGKTHTGGGAADPKAIGHHGHTGLFKDAIDAIKKGKKPLSDGAEGRRSVEIILAIYKSAETGKVVKLPLKSDPVLKARSRKQS